MTTLEIVLLSLLAGGFIVILLLAAGLLIWVGMKAKTIILKVENDFTSHLNSLERSTSRNSEELFKTLLRHREEMNVMITKINGEELTRAAKAILVSSNRIGEAAVAFGELTSQLFTQDDRIPPNHLDPNGFAPDEKGDPSFLPGVNEVLREDVN